MGSSSKKHKEKDRKKRRRSRSKERDYGHRKDKHKAIHGKSTVKEREKRKYPNKRTSSDDDLTPPDRVHVKDDIEFEGRSKEGSNTQDVGLEEGELAVEPPKGGGESISISETNKLRAKLGLKPLQMDSSIPGLGISEDGAEGTPAKEESEPRPEVFVKTENILQKKQVELLREKFAVNREKRKIAAKLSQVKTLGDSESEGEDDVISWVKKSRKIDDEKTKAAKRAKLLEEMDEEFGVGALVEEEFSKQKKSYGMRDLKGLTISHHPDAFTEGKLVVLTLKDQDILAAGEDVLENVNLVDDEKAVKNVENKTKKPDYVAYDEPEFDEFGILKKKSILAKYDEELDGPKAETFKIGIATLDREKELEIIRMKLRQQQQGVVTLEMPALKLATEYLTEEEMVKFKKPKKRVRKVRKRLKADDLLKMETSNGTIDHGSRTQGKNKNLANVISNANDDFTNQTDIMEIDNDDFEPSEIIGPDEDLTGIKVEDDGAEIELDLALQKARKLKLKESREANFRDIAHSAMQTIERDATDNAGGKGSMITLNATAEFCRTLGEIPTYGMSGNRDEEAEELMDYEKDVIEERKRLDLDAQARGAWNEVDIDDQPVEIQSRENQPILEEEPDVSVGMAGALKLAMKKGYLEKESKKLFSAPRPSQLQAQTYTIEEKFYEDDKFGRRDRYTGPIQDFKERDTYKPDVKLEYIDDSGRLLNPKEAFRYLSHKFHGKGPGKNKVDKRTKKLDQEGKLKQMSSTDTPLGTLRLLQDKQKELQSPFILLSGGSKALTQSGITKQK